MLENKMDKDNRSTFKIECNTDIFTDVEIKLLLKHGVWLRSLMHKDIQPQTDKQRHFLHVCDLSVQPETEYEFVWVKYLQQLGKEVDKNKYIQQQSNLSETRAKNLNISIELIQSIVCEHYNLSLEEMLSRNKTKTIANVRQIAMYLTKELTSHSLPEIGDAFNGRDHTTILHSVKKISELRKTNNKLDLKIKELTNIISAG